MARVFRLSIQRRRSWGIAMLGLAIVWCGGCSAPPRQHDVCLLMVDTLRADHLGVYGYTRPTSPELDRFAASSTVFADVVAPAPWTLPSVGSLMTGAYPSEHGLRGLAGARTMLSVRPGLTTLAEAMRAQGYRTVAVVSNPWMTTRKHGLQRGFDEYRSEEDMKADALHRIAREVFEADDPRPVFLYLHYMDVHGPYDRRRRGEASLGPVPERYRRPVKKWEIAHLPNFLRLPGVKRLEQYLDAYDRGIRGWDASFGAFVDWLARTRRLGHTVVAVVGDHGEEFLEHDGWYHGSTLYQEQLFVPWILHIPDSPGRRFQHQAVSLIDVAPTLLGVLGAPVPTTMTGRDVLDGSEEEVPRILFSETQVRFDWVINSSSPEVAVRRGDTKLIVDRQGIRCFDLGSDPEERTPFASGADCDTPAFREFTKWVTEVRRRSEAMGEGAPHELSAEEVEELRNLGYLE